MLIPKDTKERKSSKEKAKVKKNEVLNVEENENTVLGLLQQMQFPPQQVNQYL